MTDKEHSNSMPRMRGVFTAQNFNELLPQHKKIISRIVGEIIHLGVQEADLERALRDAYDSRQKDTKDDAYHQSVIGRQPHQSFLIDGPKGAGKTTLLLNLRCALEQIGPDGKARKPANTFDIAEITYKDFGKGADLTAFKKLRVDGTSRFLVHALPLIRPDSMEAHESVMECIFAEMTDKIDQEIKLNISHPTRDGERRRERATKLRKELHAEVAKGWYFARKLGVEALLNDSMNFDEYIERRSEEAVVSHRRVSRWMRFVNDYLNHFDAQMLAIFIDDTDISADLAADILHTIRMFFCHPRIVVLMAGNLHTIRQRLLTRALGQQAEAHKSLRAPDSFTASFWRNFERENLEEYLSKVLPRPYRHFISQSDAGSEHLLLKSSFVEFCGEQLRQRLPEYLKERSTTARRNADDSRIRWSRYENLFNLAQQQNR